MTPEEEYRHLKENAADKVMRLVQDQLVLYLPYLNRAILRLPYFPWYPEDNEEVVMDACGTDGRRVTAEPDEVIRLYKTDRTRLLRSYLHMMFHCIFCHPFQYEMLNIKAWDFCTNAAVENTILDLNIGELALPDDQERRRFLAKAAGYVKPLTAEKLYHYYYKNQDIRENDLEYAPLFALDCHELWLSEDKMAGKDRFSKDAQFDFSMHETEAMWQDVSNRIQLDVKAVARRQEILPGSAIDNIKAVYKEKRSYTDFLKKFIALKEEIKINQDEFDYIYYTYGMKLYGNMPLIEPLEYTDSSKIHDLVIAIDTSGSCQGRVVRSFLNKTYTILKDSSVFFSDLNVHIMQCDSEVHSDVKITSQTEFDEYIMNLKAEGFGGTDFRPVFERIEELQKRHEFSDLRGLIYLTDGLGTFPQVKPDYPVAFIIIEDDRQKAKVPAWAIRLDTTLEDLEKRR